MNRQPIWSGQSLKTPHNCPDKARKVRDLFDLIAPRYDLANTIISLGLSEYARSRLIRYVQTRLPRPQLILDLCSGPATIARNLAAKLNPPRIFAADFALNMLKTAQKHKLPANITLLCADAMNLPFPDNTFDLVTCVYGLRNFEDLGSGLHQIHRVLKPHGIMVAIDFQLPPNRIFRPIFNLYFKHLLPLIGSVITGSYGTGAYQYLPQSVTAWHDEGFLIESFYRAGFAHACSQRIGPGVMIMLAGEK